MTCEFADNNCWYVTFDSEESTQKVREKDRERGRDLLTLSYNYYFVGICLSSGASQGIPRAAYTSQNKGYHSSKVIWHAQGQAACAFQHAAHVQWKPIPGENAAVAGASVITPLFDSH